MTPPNSQIYQTVQIHELEAIARLRFGFTENEMMQRAGHAVFVNLLKYWPRAKSIAIFCGVGNNGGDGYSVAQIAHAHGLKVEVYQVGNSQKLTSTAHAAFYSCKKAGVSIQAWQEQTSWQTADVIVDAIYGIGLHGPVSAEMQQLFTKINQSKIPVLAIDIPSGIFADTGVVAGVAIKAAVTITFIGMKFGLVTGDGITYAGKIICDDLQFPSEIFALRDGILAELQLSQFTEYLKPRRREMHKGDAGHVLIVGGDPSHSGAPRLAAEAALRVGAGLVTVATHPHHAAALNLTLPEIMCSSVRWPFTLKKLIEKASVIVVGPGLGQSLWGKTLLKTVLSSKLPLIVDADALNLLAKQPRTRNNWILTPHPGEAARLLKQTASEVQANRLSALQQLQKHYEGVCVLKGAGTLVVGPNVPPAICKSGNPGMATAGMGDVLSGVIGALVAQGIPPLDAARLGVCLHATAGDMASKINGERGMIATDLMPYLHQLVNGKG